ncbi:MAG: hypothetical protein SGPRY_002551, partial [Prymnesium sp.]
MRRACRAVLLVCLLVALAYELLSWQASDAPVPVAPSSFVSSHPRPWEGELSLSSSAPLLKPTRVGRVDFNFSASNWSSALAKAPKHARSAGTRAPRLALALAGLGHLSSLERLPFGPHDLPPGRTLLAVGSWCSPKLGRMSVGRYAFRGARGGFLSAAMDRERLVQAPHMGHSELFQLVEADGDIYLKTYYGTYVSIWYDGSAHQTAKRGSSARLQLSPLPRGVALKTAHGTYVSLLDDNRLLSHARETGESETLHRIFVEVEPTPLAPSNVQLLVRAEWAAGGGRGGRGGGGGGGGAWCVEWGGERPSLRLCFNSSSQSQYWQQRRRDSREGGSGGEGEARRNGEGSREAEGRQQGADGREGEWEGVGGEVPLQVHPGEAFELAAAVDKLCASYSLRGGPWLTVGTRVSLLELSARPPRLVSLGAHLRRVGLVLDHTDALQMLPSFG